MSGKNRFPFTPCQWQELEHQALIFKYMVSGIPIPPDLLFAIKRSYLDPAVLPSKLFPHHSQHGKSACLTFLSSFFSAAKIHFRADLVFSDKKVLWVFLLFLVDYICSWVELFPNGIGKEDRPGAWEV